MKHYTVSELSGLLNVTTQFVRTLIHTGKLNAVNVNPEAKRPLYRIPREDGDALLAGRVRSMSARMKEQETKEVITNETVTVPAASGSGGMSVQTVFTKSSCDEVAGSV